MRMSTNTQTKKMMYNQPEILHAFLDHIAENIAAYAIHQFLNPGLTISARKILRSLGSRMQTRLSLSSSRRQARSMLACCKDYLTGFQHPEVPIIYFANGGSSYLDLQRDMKVQKAHVPFKETLSVMKTDRPT
eukprot:390990-Hanusia_phi.AAC.2